MKLNISLSIERILESVYAHSAAHSFDCGKERPSLLGSDQEEMLKSICRDIIAGLFFKMAGSIKSTDLGTSAGGDLISAELEMNDDTVPSVLRTAMETAIAAGVLSAVWAGHDSKLSERYKTVYDDCIALLGRLGYRDKPGAIRAAV